MQFLEEMLAVEGVVPDVVANFGRVLILVVEKVLVFGLASVDHIFFELLLVHIHLLVLEVVVLLLVLVVF